MAFALWLAGGAYAEPMSPMSPESDADGTDAAATEAPLPTWRLDVDEAQQAAVRGPIHQSELALHILVVGSGHDAIRDVAVVHNGRPAWAGDAAAVVPVDAATESAPSAPSTQKRWRITTPALPLALGPNTFVIRVRTANEQQAELEFTQVRTEPRGELPALSSTTTTLLRGDFTVGHDWTIPADHTVTLAAGTVLRFAPGVGLVCHGRLIVSGTDTEPVWFLPATWDHPWANLVITGPAASANLRHAIFIRGSGRPNAWTDGRTVPVVDLAPGQLANQGTDGGALMLVSASATTPTKLAQCRVALCRATPKSNAFGMGGAMFVEHSELHLTDCDVESNQACDGGALYVCQAATIRVRDSRFRLNLAERDGGAWSLLMNTAAEFRGCRVVENSAGRNGGGVNLNVNSRAEVIDCDFVANRAGKAGAGMLALHNQLGRFERCRFEHNRAQLEGGGAYVSDLAQVEWRTSCFKNNSAGTTGGGLAILNCAPTLTQCDVEANRADKDGGAGGVAVRYGKLSSGEKYSGAKLSFGSLAKTNTIRDNQPRDWQVHGAE